MSKDYSKDCQNIQDFIFENIENYKKVLSKSDIRKLHNANERVIQLEYEYTEENDWELVEIFEAVNEIFEDLTSLKMIKDFEI